MNLDDQAKNGIIHLTNPTIAFVPALVSHQQHSNCLFCADNVHWAACPYLSMAFLSICSFWFPWPKTCPASSNHYSTGTRTPVTPYSSLRTTWSRSPPAFARTSLKYRLFQLANSDASASAQESPSDGSLPWSPQAHILSEIHAPSHVVP